MHIVCVSAQTLSRIRRKKKHCDRSSRFVRMCTQRNLRAHKKVSQFNLINCRAIFYRIDMWPFFDCIFSSSRSGLLSVFLSYSIPRSFVRLFILPFRRFFYGAQFAWKTLFSLISNGIRLTLITSNVQLSNCVWVYLSLCATTIIQKCPVARSILFLLAFSASQAHTLNCSFIIHWRFFGCNLCTFF